MNGDAPLRRLGVQPRPFRSLLWSFIAMDLRGQFYAQSTGTASSEVLSPLFWVVGQMLTISLLLCLVQQGRVEAWFYAGSHLTVTMILMFSAILVEFQEAAYDPADVEVVGHRPVTARTWSLARILNLSMYVLLIGVSLTLFPTLMGLGLRDTGMSWLILYPWAATIVVSATASAALLLYTASGIGVPGDNIRRLAAWVQILGVLLLFYGGQLMLRNASGGLALFASNPPPWVAQLPTAFLARDVASGSMVFLAAGTAVSGALTYSALLALRGAWTRVARVARAEPHVEIEPGSPEALAASSASGTLFPSRREGAVFWLTFTMLSRDGELKSRNLPAVILPATAALLGPAIGQYADPMVGHSTDNVLPMATMVLLATAIPTLLNNLTFSRDHEAAWRLRPSWGESAARAVQLAVHVRILLPLLLVHGVAIGLYWKDPIAAAVYTAITWLILDLIMRLVSRTVLSRPILRRPAARGATVGAISIVVAGVSALAGILAAIWFFVAPYPPLLTIFAVALLVIGRSIPAAGHP